MSKKLLNLCMAGLMSLVGTAAWALSEVGGVYQIGTAADFNAFAELVNGGNPYVNAVLTADIDRGTDGTMIGKDGVDYQGTFDGQGHTITINMFDAGENGTALFRNLGARGFVKDLKVQGTITTSRKYAAGIAAWSSGTVSGCYVDVNVVSAMAGDATHGGIAGVSYQGAMVENCLAKFTINGATTENCGGIVGWCDGRTNVINCLVINDGSSFGINGSSGTIGRNDGNLQTVNLSEYIGNEYDKRPGGASGNNYATNAWGNTKTATIVPLADLADGRICYQLNTDQSHIAWTQTIGTDPFPVPAAFGGKQVYASGPTDCDGKSEGELTFSNSGTPQATAHQFDRYGICTTCGCFNIYGLQRDPADGYYLLASAEDIDLAEGFNRIQNGGQFSLKMTEDIEYTAEPTRYIFNSGNWFDGNFNGQGHELTIEMSDMGNAASLFPNFGGVYFENVIMHGTINTTGQYAGSITGHTRRGRTMIRNVFSDITINTTHTGDNTSAGFIGVVEEKTQVDNSIYAGDINGLTEDAQCLAGFAGWSSGQTYYTNCAFLGTLNGAVGDSKTFSRCPANVTLTNVYTANSYGFEDELKEGVKIIEDLADIESGALAYALNGNQGGVERFYQKIGEDPMPMPIAKDGALVYAVSANYRCDGSPIGTDVTYSNNPNAGGTIPPHQFEDGFCSVCNTMQEDFLTPVDGWFNISNGKELVWWTNYAAKHLDVSARLTEDIDMEADGCNEDGETQRWANVGTEGKPFYGNFDGQFHTISKLVINHPGDNGVGLIAVMNSLPEKGFGGISDSDARAAEGVYIKNVVLDETCSITGKGYVALVGMTAGFAGHVTIQGVMMCGDVTAADGPNAAGVFGCVMNSACHVTINNCGMVGDVKGPRENGSFSGWLGDWAEVTNCFAVGLVEGYENENRYFARYGDARVNDNIKNCYALHGTQEHVGIVTAEDFESGALAWRANGEQFRTAYWYQTLGEDPYPFPDPSHGTVIFAADQYFSIADEADIDEVSAAIQTYEEEAVADVIATQSLLNKYSATLASLADATTIPEFADVLDSVSVQKKEIAENAATYKAFADKCEEIKARLESDTSFQGDLRTALEAYLNESEEPSEENPLGTYSYIMDNHTATAAEVKAEMERVMAWLNQAIAEDYAPGTDVTSMLANADFSEGYNEKWTNGFATGSGTTKSGDAEKDKTIGVEAWAQTGDMFQTIEDMKPGYYLVGTHAAFRPSNDRYNTNYAAGIYANGTFNYFPAAIEDYLAAADTLDQVNCNLHGDGAHDLAIYDDMVSTSDEEAGTTPAGYIPQGERGMAAAANDGRYQVYTLGKVGEDGKLTIGIKNPGTKYDNDWTGWTAIKVTYLGEEPTEGVADVLENMTARANTMLEYAYDDTTPTKKPNYPAELLDELQGILDADADEFTTIDNLSSVFQKIYEGKQAYAAMYQTAAGLETIGTANLNLVEKDEETGEWMETGETLFSGEETQILEDAAGAMYDAFFEGAYSTAEALEAAKADNPEISSLIPAKDEEGYYLIATPKDVAAFRAFAMNADNASKAKMTADVDMTGIAMQPINSSDNRFRGIFDGQAHALKNVYINYEGEGSALFSAIDGGTVKNLKLTGDYYSGPTGKFMAGIAGWAKNAKIQNCDVAVTLNSTVEGDGTHGGIIGNNDGDGTIVENCLVRSTLLGASTNSCGGVIGWSGSLSTVRNTLILSQGNTIDTSNGCNTISRNDGNCTVESVFYVETIGTANGTKATAEQLASGEITYKLNGSKSEGDLAWFQTIGTDATPRLFDGPKVYFYGGQYINDVPNPQLNAFAYDLDANLRGSNVVVDFKLNAEAESAEVNFYDGKTLVYTETVAEELSAGQNRVTVEASKLGSEPTALNYEIVVNGKGTKEVTKVGEGFKISSPYGLAVNNNPKSAGFGQILVTDARPGEDREGMDTQGNPGALYAINAAFQPVGIYYGGLNIREAEPLSIAGDYKFDLKDIRFTEDGRLFVARASGTTNSSVWEINPDDLEEAWKPVFTGGELDEATGITYVGDDEQNRMAVSLAVEGKGDDLKLYVLGAQRSNGEYNTTDYNCAFYNLGTATEWTAAPSGYLAALDGVYTIAPGHVGIHEDGEGGLWYVQYRANPTAELPSIKHFDAEGNEDFSDITTATYSGKMAVTADGKYLAIPMGSGKVVVYETNYVPMANGRIYLNPIQNISVSETQITGLAFDYAGNLYAASSGTKTLNRYAIPSLNGNKVVTPGNGIGTASATGDVNGDGKVDIADAVSVLNVMADGSNLEAADVNGDGKVDIADFVSVLNIMAEQ